MIADLILAITPSTIGTYVHLCSVKVVILNRINKVDRKLD